MVRQRQYGAGHQPRALSQTSFTEREVEHHYYEYFFFFFLEKVRAKYTFYFKLLRDSPIDQIVQTVFGYSLRKE